jgi:hypothetical protein
LRERSPSRPKEDGVELAVVLKEDPYTFWDGEDGVAVWDIFDNFAIDVLGELHCSLGAARGAYTTALAGEGDEERVFAAVAVTPRGAISKATAV